VSACGGFREDSPLPVIEARKRVLEEDRQRGVFTMVYYFKARPELGDYTIYMGLDKFENEDLIKYGWPEDIWYVRRKVCMCLSLCFLETLHVCFFLMEKDSD